MEASPSFAARARGAARSADWMRLLGLVLGVAGGALLVAAELSTIVSVDVARGTCGELAGNALRDACRTSGLEQHGGALIVLGAAAAIMALAAARGTNRPAAIALLVIGAVALTLALARDLDKADDTGVVGLRYEKARAVVGPGLYLEIAGGALCVLAGGLTYPRRERAWS